MTETPPTERITIQCGSKSVSVLTSMADYDYQMENPPTPVSDGTTVGYHTIGERSAKRITVREYFEHSEPTIGELHCSVCNKVVPTQTVRVPMTPTRIGIAIRYAFHFFQRTEPDACPNSNQFTPEGQYRTETPSEPI